MAEHVIAPLATVATAVGNLLIEEAKFLYDVEDQVKALQTEFHRIQWFLRDADRHDRKIGDGEKRFQQWVLEAKDIAYDAEDLLEGYAFKLGNTAGFLRVLKKPYARHQLGANIQALNSRILSLYESFQRYGVTAAMEGEGSSSVQQQLRRTYSFVDEQEDFVGLESDVDLLVDHLVNRDDFRVVSITGMGGSGKTTVAKKVYNHPDVKPSFQGFAWICVSQQWETKDLLQRMLFKLEPGEKAEIEKGNWSKEELIRHLRDVQQRTKCLVVLDDIWTTDAWDCIKAAFPGGRNGSKILLTTRKRDVALHIGPDGFHHQPRLLSVDESWELLRRKALLQRADGIGHLINEFAVLGKKMVEQHCGGLPLAVIVLGGILSTKEKDLREWETVHQNIKSYLWKAKGFGKGKGDLAKVLGMSYYDLPYELKPCFLYLAAFPEDAEIEADTIYQLWMAEGLVLQDRGNNESIMKLAEQYLGELGQRGMVQLGTRTSRGMRRRKKICRLHDVMRELCLLEAENENFMSSVKFSSREKGANSLLASSNSILRRIVITFGDEDEPATHMSQYKERMKFLRMVRYEVPSEHVTKEVTKQDLNIFEDFDRLRVLSIAISERKDCKLELPKAIGELIHLKYLSTRDCGFFCDVKLPSSLGNLKHMQTLDLRNAVLPPDAEDIFLKMTGLISLYLPIIRYEHISGKIRLCSLAKLEILENFRDSYYETEDLIKLINLRVLKGRSCKRLENLEMIATHVQKSKRLEYASVSAYGGDFRANKENGCLEQFQFARRVSILHFRDDTWEFLENDICNILKLSIYFKDLNVLQEAVNTLEQLPCLRVLQILSPRASGKEMCFHAAGFPQLCSLRLHKFEEMEMWVVEEGAMPNLHTLEIQRCRKLQAIPDGLRFISSLHTLRIWSMPPEFKKRIRAPYGEDFHKISHVPTIRIG